MKQAVLHLKQNIGEYLFKVFLSLVGFWILFALCFQLFFVYLQFSGKEDLARDISNEITRLTELESSIEYQRLRKAEYPSFAEQFDTLYHEGYDAWKASIQVIKDKYPKY